MQLVAGSGMDHVAYILILYSVAFIVFLFVNILIGVYDRAVNADFLAAKYQQLQSGSAVEAGPARVSGHVRSDSHEVRDAEEFELGELLTDDEDDEERSSRRKLLKEEAIGDDSEEGGLVNGNGTARHS